MDQQLWSRLPLDILAEVISHIDSSTPRGRRDLLQYARFSRAILPAAEEALYRYVFFTPYQLEEFLRNVLGDGSERTVARARRLIAVIEHLEIVGPEDQGVPVGLLWAAAYRLHGRPLFPRVREFTVMRHHAMEHGEDHYRSMFPTTKLLPPPQYAILRWPARDPYSSHPDVLIFDAVDICVTGAVAYTLLNVLPVRRVVSVTVHDTPVTHVVGYFPWAPVWSHWESFTMFHSVPYFQWEAEATMEVSVNDCVRALEAFSRGTDRGHFRLVVCGTKWKGPSLDLLGRRWQNSTFPVWYLEPWWPCPTNHVQLDFYDRGDTSAPACTLCRAFGIISALTLRWPFCESATYPRTAPGPPAPPSARPSTSTCEG